jgi:hypothetical protein
VELKLQKRWIEHEHLTEMFEPLDKLWDKKQLASIDKN